MRGLEAPVRLAGDAIAIPVEVQGIAGLASVQGRCSSRARFGAVAKGLPASLDGADPRRRRPDNLGRRGMYGDQVVDPALGTQ